MEVSDVDSSGANSINNFPGISTGVTDLWVRHCCSFRQTWCSWMVVAVVGMGRYIGW